MNTWAVLKTKILYGLLAPSGTPQEAGISESQLLVGAGFALTELSFHTGCPARKEYLCDGQTNVFVLPKDSIDYFNKTAAIHYVVGGKKSYVPFSDFPKSAIVQPDTTTHDWIEWPQGLLRLGFMPANGSQVFVDYYKQWSAPIDDDSMIEIPDWMETPFCYLVAARALESVGTQYSSINQWRRKVDSGDPLDNPILEQVKHYMAQAHYILTRITPQDRDRWYQND